MQRLSASLGASMVRSTLGEILPEIVDPGSLREQAEAYLQPLSPPRQPCPGAGFGVGIPVEIDGLL